MAKILVVDEETLIYDVIAAALEDESHEVTGIREAAEVAELVTVSWDLVLLHTAFPWADLEELAAMFRESGAAIILLSSDIQEASSDAALKLSARSVIRKPLDPREVRQQVEETLLGPEPEPPEVPSEPRILVVDDDELVRLSVVDILQDEGFTVSSASSAEDAVELLEDGAIDVLLTDVMMGGMSGLDLMATLPVNNRDVVVVVMTGYARKDVAVAALRQGAFDLLEKPLEPSRVVSAVRRAWRMRRAELRNRRFLFDLRRLNRELEEARDQAEAASRAKSELLTNMSHEFRTPLNGILGCLQLLQSVDLSDRQRSWLEAARKSGISLSSLLTALLDYVDLEGAAVPSPTTVDLGSTLREIVEARRQQFEDLGLDLKLETDGTTEARVRGDVEKIERLVQILLDNALSFTSKGEVVAGLESDDREVRIRVADTGIGIAPAHQETIFEPFFQVDGSMTRGVGGAGMGLALAARLVACMKGRIEVESELGAGSRFVIRLPLPTPSETD